MGNDQSNTAKILNQDKKYEKRVASKFIKQLTAKKPSDLVDEYNEISNSRPVAKDNLHGKQAVKNRYRDIECQEASRVVLKNRDPQDNYIHANWVITNNQKYILTQAPLAHTTDDFWFMVATEKVGSIIMLCDLVEEGQRKCADYWPHEDGGKSHYGDVTVENVSVGHSTLPKVQVTILRVTYDKKSHLLNHYQWLGWPDDGVPDDHILPSKLIDLARDCVKPITSNQAPDPIVVHCSAGVGRTGTLVAIDMARSKLISGGSLNASKLVKELRDQRTHAIQGPLQYMYLNLCILQICAEIVPSAETFAAHKWLEKCQAFIKEYKEANINR